MENKKVDGGWVFDIQGFSVHDGPGCRTLIFLKGCTLNCCWCANPEGIEHYPVLMYNPEKCTLDGNCSSSCRLQAIKIKNGTLSINRNLCRQCNEHSCEKDCYSGALQIAGYFISFEELTRIIKRDRQYWGAEGGITLSGGEPLLQIDFASNILRYCHENYIHTALETCGNVSWKNFEKIIDFTDFIFFDLKHLDSKKHKELTGSGNELILDNCRRLAGSFAKELKIRMVLIPGYNDSREHLLSVAEFLQAIGLSEINLLPLHHLGKRKYFLLQKDYSADNFKNPAAEELLQIKYFFKEQRICCNIE